MGHDHIFRMARAAHREYSNDPSNEIVTLSESFERSLQVSQIGLERSKAFAQQTKSSSVCKLLSLLLTASIMVAFEQSLRRQHIQHFDAIVSFLSSKLSGQVSIFQVFFLLVKLLFLHT